MATGNSPPPLPRILAETVLAAICLFSIPLSLDLLSKTIHAGSGPTSPGKLALVLAAAVLAVLLLADVYRMMRRRGTAPSSRSVENTGSNNP